MKKFVNFLSNNYDMTKKEADELVEECVYAARIGHGPHDVKQFLSHSLEFKDLKAVHALGDQLIHLMNNTREWFLKGLTSQGLHWDPTASPMLSVIKAG